MNEITGLAILFALIGLLFAGLSIPLILRRVPPNMFYGCRTRKTLSDSKIWYEANHASGRDFLISGLLVFAASLLILILGQTANPNYAIFILLGVILISLSAMIWREYKREKLM